MMGRTFLASQFHMLQAHSPGLSPDKVTEARKTENIDKNRCEDILPSNEHRVKIFSKATGGIEYINAVFVDSNKQPNGYIATQWPLHGTIGDLWQMAVDYGVNDIVVLVNKDDDEAFPAFYPVEDSWLCLDDITIKNLGTQCLDGTCIHDISVWEGKPPKEEAVYANTSNSGLRVRIWQFKANPNQVQQNKFSLQSLLHVHKHVCQQGLAHRRPVVVVCEDGASVCGQFIAMCQLLDMVDTEKEVDVFYVAHMIRKARPEFIATENHFLSLHNMLKEYLETQHVCLS